MIFITIYIYSYLYLCIYTPSYPHFKAFLVSKFNSETSFLYQLFKENSNIIVLKPGKFKTRQVLIDRSWPSKIKNSFFFSFNFFLNFYFIYLFMYFFVYTPSNQHFKAFLVSKFNSETSFLYQLFKENSNFIVTEPCKVICKSIFYDFHYYLYLFESLFMHLYTFISTF